MTICRIAILLTTSLGTLMLFSSCAATGKYHKQYDEAVASANTQADYLKIKDSAGFTADEIVTEEYLKTFAESQCHLKWAKRKHWPKKAAATCAGKHQKEFFKLIVERYRFMDVNVVTDTCKAYGNSCDNKLIEAIARQTHNKAVDYARDEDIRSAAHIRDRHISAAKRRNVAAWAAAFNGMAAGMQNTESQPTYYGSGFRANRAVSQDDQASGQYLGNLSANPYSSNSLANPYGAGSPYNANSIKNPYGQYGSAYSNKSANNPYATDAPKLYDNEGNYRGKLSNNPYDPDSVSNPNGRYGSPYSADSINNPYGAGNPYKADSPNNPYGHGLKVIGQ